MQVNKCHWLGSLVLAAALMGASPMAAADGSGTNTQKQIKQLQQAVKALKKRSSRQRRAILALEKRLKRAKAGASTKKHGQSQHHKTAQTHKAATSKHASTQHTSASHGSNHRSSPKAPSSHSRHSAPQSNSVKAVYRRENALFEKGLTLTPKLSYSYSSHHILNLNGFLALGSIFLGNINVTHQRNHIYQAGLDATYGVTHHFKLDFKVPYLIRRSTFISAGAQHSTQQKSEHTVGDHHIGDVSFGMYYQVLTQHGPWPNLILHLQGVAPTGKAPYGIPVVHGPNNKSLQYPKSLPTGQGVWSVVAGMSVIKTVSPAVLYFNAQYERPFIGHFGNISTQSGSNTPGYARPGDQVAIDMGTAFAITRRVSLNFGYQEQFSQATHLKRQGQSWSRVVGSAANAASFDIGTTYALTRKFSLDIQAKVGVTNAAPSSQIELKLPYHF